MRGRESTTQPDGSSRAHARARPAANEGRSGRAPVVPLPDLEDPDWRGPFMEALGPIMRGLTPELIVRDGAAYLDAWRRRAAWGPSPSPATAWAGVPAGAS